MPLTALGFLAVFTAGCTLALRRPFVGLLLYFFVFYLHPPGKYWGQFIPDLRWTLIVALVTLVGALFNEKGLLEGLKAKPSKYLIAFFVFVNLQLPWVINGYWHSDYIVLLGKMIVLYFIIIALVNSLRRLVWVITTNLILAAYIGLEALQTHTRGRLDSAGLPSIDDANLLAIHFTPVVIMGAFLFLSKYFKQRSYLLFLPLAFAGNLILMTSSRGAIAAIAFAGVVAILIATKDIRKSLIKWAAVGLFAVSFLSINMIIDRFESIRADDMGQIQEKSAASRIVILKSQLEMIGDNPLMGGGHRTTLLLSPLYIPSEYLTQTEIGGIRASHNLTMSIFADHGLIGGSFYFMFIGSCLVIAFRIIRNQRIPQQERLVAMGLLIAYIGTFTASQFSNSKVLEVSLWIYALIVALEIITKRVTFHPSNKTVLESNEILSANLNQSKEDNSNTLK